MYKNKNCTACKIKLGRDNYWKDRTVCNSCYNKEKRNYKNNTLIKNQQPKIDNINTSNNNRSTVLVGPSFSGKTYTMLKFLPRSPDRDFYIITNSPPEQYCNSKIKNKEIAEEIKPLNEYKNAIVFFDDILGTSKSKYIDQFFIRGGHNIIHINYQSQSFYDLPNRTIRNNINKNILFNQTLKGRENICRDIGGYDMSFDEFKQLCR